jgi:hypothetical protein
LDADEDGLFGQRHARRVVLGVERRERGVDRDRSLPAALRVSHPQQSPREVDVVPVEPEQLASAEAGVGHEREREPVALGLPVEVALPELVAAGLSEETLEFAHGQDVGENLALLRRPQRQRRVADKPLLLDEEAEERLQRRRRPRLARQAGRRFCSSARKARRCVTFTSARSLMPPCR